MGDYAGTRLLFERAIAIYEKAGNSDVAYSLNHLAKLFQDAGEYASAQPLFERALAIQEKALGPESYQTAETLDHFANLLAAAGDYTRARPLYERALTVFEKAFGPDHYEVIMALNNLANLLRNTGDYVRAKSLYDRAMAIVEKYDIPEHSYMAELLANLAKLHAAVGDTTLALQTALRAEEIGRDHFRFSARTLAERQALRYAAVRTTGLDLALSVTADAGNEFPENRQQVWDAVIRSRALVLDEMAARHRALGHTDDPEIARLSQALVSARQRLANLMVRGPDTDAPEGDRHLHDEVRENNPEKSRRLLDEARKEKEQAEHVLAEKSATFRQEQAKSRIGFAEVAAALPPHSALVAFARYGHLMTSGKPATSADSSLAVAPGKLEARPAYLAFVLRSGESKPVIMPFGTAEEIETLVSQWNEEAARGVMVPSRSQKHSETLYRNAGEALRRKIWDPVASHLSGATIVFVVPDGVLNLVNLAALPAGQSDYLVESGPLIHYLSAERDLVSSESTEIKGEGLLALGGPAFNETTLFSALARKGRKAAMSSQAQTGTSQTYRGQRSNCSDFQSMRFEPLPASAREVKEIVSLWTSDSVAQQKAAAVINLTGAKASETAFKEQALGRRVLHLATHGFFLGDRCSSALRSSRGVGGVKKVEQGEPAPQIISDNPLLLSGLALAGANHRAKAGPEEDDGILTAEEIAAMNLSGVEWAVLSACETGVGKVEAGEGVFGLRRAFQMAGAGTLIMSLWSVEDEAARQWMRALYEGRLVKKLSTAESVRAASLEVLRSRREKGQNTHPFFWAGFVAAGDWR